MIAPHERESMIRKPIHMTKALIAKVDTIAEVKRVSFAEVVRDAVDAYDTDIAPEDSKFLELMLDSALKSLNDSIHKIESLEFKLDQTHQRLEAQRGHRG
jgi:hypothetical protein